MAKKIPSNFYQEVNIRKLDKVFSNEGDLPTPSVSDEGKVIKVNNEGKYALLPDGGAHTMTVAITYDETTEEYSADKTHADIIAALQAGVIVKATYSDQTFVYAGTNKPAAFDGVYFTYIQADSEDQLLCKCFEIDVDDRIVYSSHNISEELPVVDSSDNGSILSVSGGVWGKGYKIVDNISDSRLKALIMVNNEIRTCSQEIQFYTTTAAVLDPDDGYYHINGYFAYMTNNIGVYTKLKHTDDVSVLHADISTILRFTIGNITLDSVQTSLNKYCLIGINAYPSVTLYSIINTVRNEVLIDRTNNKAYRIEFNLTVNEVAGSDTDYEIMFKLHPLA